MEGGTATAVVATSSRLHCKFMLTAVRQLEDSILSNSEPTRLV